MIYIKKNVEPLSLVEQKKTPGINFDSIDKRELKKSLLKEQGYICAYCMSRIRDDNTTKIEHYVARNEGNELDYSNLLAVCTGNEIKNGHQNPDRFTCDTRKKNSELHISPLMQGDMDTIRYDGNGTIYSSNDIYDNDLNDVLNLNDPYGYLKSNRKSALKAIMMKLEAIPSKRDATTTLKKWKKYYDDCDSVGQYKEYVGIIRWYIDRQLRKHQ